MFSRIMPAHSAGGMQDHVQTLSVGLAHKGLEVTVISSARVDAREFEVIDGVQVHFLQGTPPGRNTNAYWFAAARKLEELQAKRPFDVLHSQSVGAYGVWKKGLNRKYRLPLITSFHGTHLDVLTTSWHTDFSLTNPLGTARFFAIALNLFYRYAYRDLWFTRGSDILIATSDADVSKYKSLYGVGDGRIRKVYNGIDVDLFAPRDPGGLRTTLGIDPSTKILLALARLEKDKGVQNAIEVLPQILREMPACLVVVGDGKYRAALERLARERGVAEQTRFAGAQSLSECARYFNLCDLFLDPTLRTDGYDLTIAEAMACQKPAIVSDVGANSTLIDAATQSDGVLIPRGDNEALTMEIRRLLLNPEAARAMGKQARKKIVARFSISAMVQGMERVYEEAVRSGGAQ
jgi:glycosyltransferase involved in cell wall biosynthesis